jgi:hypothetical protein
VGGHVVVIGGGRGHLRHPPVHRLFEVNRDAAIAWLLQVTCSLWLSVPLASVVPGRFA